MAEEQHDRRHRQGDHRQRGGGGNRNRRDNRGRNGSRREVPHDPNYSNRTSLLIAFAKYAAGLRGSEKWTEVDERAYLTASEVSIH